MRLPYVMRMTNDNPEKYDICIKLITNNYIKLQNIYFNLNYQFVKRSFPKKTNKKYLWHMDYGSLYYELLKTLQE